MSSISAGLSNGTALVSTGDTTGELVLKTNGGTTAVTIGTDQSVTFAAGVVTTSPTVLPAGTASAPALTTTGDTNTGIFFPAADTIAFAEGGAEAMRIDSSGIVLTGLSSALTVSGASAWQQQLAGTGATGYIAARFSNNANPARFIAVKSRGASIGTNTVVQNGDELGSIDFAAADGTDYTTAARISGFVDGAPGTGDLPTRLTFNTAADGSTTPTERMRIDSSGNLLVGYGGQSPTAFTAPQGMTISSLDNVALQYYLRKGNQVEAHIGFKSSTDTNFYVGTGGGAGPAGIGAYGTYQTNLASTWTSVSDERVKTELVPIENALQKVGGVRAVTGRYTYDEENGSTKRRAFLIAQDFVSALPEAVDQNDPEKLGLSYSDTIVLAFAAIKELKAELDEAKARIATLEGNTPEPPDQPE
jgi:hypothetical protein